MNLVEFVFQAVSDSGEWTRIAITCANQEISYRELFDQVTRCGGMLRAAGFEPGDRIAIVARDGPEFVASFLGAVAVRCVAVPLSTMLGDDELGYLLGHCGAKGVIATGDQARKILGLESRLGGISRLWFAGLHPTERPNPNDLVDFEEALAAADPAEIEPAADDELAFMLYTSGSTGRPKGALHLHRNLPFTVNAYCRNILKANTDDRFFSSSRLFFAYGLGNSLSYPLSSGASVILEGQRPSPAVIASVLSKHKPTIFFGVPAVFRALLQYAAAGHSLDTTSIKFCVSAGEKLPEVLFHQWKNHTGLDILDGIGSTEMLQTFMSNSRDHIKPGSSGQPVPGYDVKLSGPAGDEVLGAGEGQLLVRGGSASPGYWNDALKTAETIQDGWVRTGDLYRRDEEGTYWFCGRADDLFKVNGLWVQPGEVEEALLASEEILEAAVVPGLDSHGMSIAVAYVVLKSEGKPDDSLTDRLRDRAARQLPSFKCPAEFRFLDRLPRTATGKLERYKLRDPAARP